MKTLKIWRIALAMLAAFSLASCSSDDDNEDKVEQVMVYVSAETEIYYDMWLDPERENPIVGYRFGRKGAAFGGLSASIPSRTSHTSVATSTNCW